MRAYSMDLRGRVFADRQAGMTTATTVAQKYTVSKAWVRRLKQRQAATGSLAPGRPASADRSPRRPTTPAPGTASGTTQTLPSPSCGPGRGWRSASRPRPSASGGPGRRSKKVVNGDLFVAYAERVLVPTLRPRDVVVDNPACHRRVAAVKIEKAGVRSRTYPPHSPDFNPIEMAFAKVKARLRAAELRTIDRVEAFPTKERNAGTPFDTPGIPLRIYRKHSNTRDRSGAEHSPRHGTDGPFSRADSEAARCGDRRESARAGEEGKGSGSPSPDGPGSEQKTRASAGG